MTNLLEKIKSILHPKVFTGLSQEESNEITNNYILQLSKFENILDIFIQKEAALDKFLKDWNKENLQKLLSIMDTLKKQITAEWGSFDEFKKAVTCEYDKLHNPTSFLLDIIRSLNSLYECLKEQFQITTYGNRLINNKMCIGRFVNSVVDEYELLQSLFNIETKHADDLANLYKLYIFSPLREYKRSSEYKKEFFYFIQNCIELVMKSNITAVLVTDDSARILGIMILDQLKQRGIKLPVFGFNPRPITAALEVEPSNKREIAIEKLSDSFKKERKAITKSITGASILIIDEFAQRGNTLSCSKYFFKRLGAEKVYTALFSGKTTEPNEKPDIFGNAYMFYNVKLGRNKDENIKSYFVKEFEDYPIKTRTNIIRSKYKVMNDFYAQLIKDYKEFMKKIASGEIK